MDEPGVAISLAVAVVAAVLAVASVVLARRARARARRTLERTVGALDESLASIAGILAQSLERAQAAPGRPALALTLDLDELLLGIAREAAARTGARATAIRVRGPGDDPAVATFGADDVAPLLESTLRSPQGRPFRAMTINWTFPPTLEADTRAFRSALVVPVVEDGIETGAIAGYATESAAFRPEHARALESLAAEAAEGIATARRFTAMRQRATGSPAATARSRERDEPDGDELPRTEAPRDSRG